MKFLLVTEFVVVGGGFLFVAQNNILSGVVCFSISVLIYFVWPKTTLDALPPIKLSQTSSQNIKVVGQALMILGPFMYVSCLLLLYQSSEDYVGPQVVSLTIFFVGGALLAISKSKPS